MKTPEQKLLILLRIAIENGWKPKYWILLQFLQMTSEHYREVTCKFEDFEVSDNWLEYVGGHYDISYSLNDLITNWEPEEVSFIEALCNADPEGISHTYLADKDIQRLPDFYLHYQKLRMVWELKPTSERLTWLFDMFNHLIEK